MLDVVQPMNLNLRVVRSIFTEKSAVGELFIDGKVFCYTLEPPKREAKPRCIPVGLYDVTVRYSEKHKRLMPHVESVPGFEGIEIHPGNYPKDTEGCLLVGATYAPDIADFIGNSTATFDKLFTVISGSIDGGNKVYITYMEQEPNL